MRPYRRGDEELILSAWELAFGKSFPRAWWFWKYLENPAGFSALLCFSPEGELAVYYGGQRCRVWYGGHLFTAFHLADIFTHPAYRWAIGGKRSLFTKVARIFWKTYLKNCPFEDVCALEGLGPKVDFFWGIPGKRHFRLGELTVSYKSLPGGCFYAEAKGCTRRLSGRYEILPFDKELLPAFKKLWQTSPVLIKCRLAKDRSFLFWRYGKHPQRPYKMLALFKGFSRRPQAFLVLREKEDSVIILDFLAPDLYSLWELLKACFFFFPGRALRIWMARNETLQKVFLSAGWQALREPLGIIPALEGFIPEISAIRKDFFWVMGDADLF